MTSIRRRVLAAATTGIATAAVGVSAPGALAASPSAGSEAVIVVLANQLSGAPATTAHIDQRRSEAHSAQQSVLNRLSGPAPRNVKYFAVANAFSATVTANQSAALAGDPSVAAVIPDTKIEVSPPQDKTKQPAGRSATRAKAPSRPTVQNPFGICPTNPARPLLEPEALSAIHAASTDGSPNAHQLATGAGVKVGFIADGLNPNAPDFIRPDGSHVIVDYKDFSGEGLAAPSGGGEAFGDASSIAAQGTLVHNLSDWVNPAHPLPPNCTIRVLGVAPGASVVALKAGGELLLGSSILQAIDYAVSVKHVDVLNESFGGNVFADSGARNTVQLFNDQAVAAGVTVTTSSGDSGITSTIGTPGTDPLVIDAGASTTFQLYKQIGYGAFGFSNGKWANNNIAALSSSGFTQSGSTVDLVAPGDSNWATCTAGFADCPSIAGGSSSDLDFFGGTSESAPLTAGVAALVIQAYRRTHNHRSPSPALVKRLITSTTTDLGAPAQDQGAGLLNARAAVEAALTYPGANRAAPAGTASNIAVSTDQLSIEGRPGSTHTRSVTVTNIGNKSLTVAAGSRRLIPFATSTRVVSFHPATDPTFTYWNGTQRPFQKVSITVPANADRLDVQTAFPGRFLTAAGGLPLVQIALLAPDGTYEANSSPQGPANHTEVSVVHPVGGTWTGILWSGAGAAAFTGPVHIRATTQRAVPVGQVSPASFHLAPGAARNVSVTLTTPQSGGDAANSVTFGTSNGHLTSVAAVLRSVVPTSSGTGHFTGTITGGNGRGLPGQTFSYAFDVPKGKHDLDLTTVLAKDANTALEGVLIDPNGEAPSIGANAVFDDQGNVTQSTKSLQQYVANPIPGRWRFVLAVQDPVSGNEISQNFRGTIGFDRVSVSAPTLPHSTHTTLARGLSTKVPVIITNTGSTALRVAADARTAALQTLQLVPQFNSATVPQPISFNNTGPAFIVPPDTTKLVATASSSVPAQVELQSPGGGIDVFGDLTQAQHGSTVSVARVSENNGATLGTGFWLTTPVEVGPFGAAPAPTGVSVVGDSVRTRGFDRAVTSATGDPYLAGLDPNAGGGTTVSIGPGRTATITVSIRPTAHIGATVSGVLHLVTAPQIVGVELGAFATTGDVITTLPYSYTVGAPPKP